MSILEQIREKRIVFTVPLYLVIVGLIIILGWALLFPLNFLLVPEEESGYGSETYYREFMKVAYYKEFMKVADECTGSTQREIDTCILSHAAPSNDLNLCGIIMDKAVRQKCIALVKKDKSLCNTISQQNLREECISQIEAFFEEFEKGPPACRLPKGYQRDFCLYNEAIKKKDTKPCNEIINEPIKLMCIAVLNVDRELCNELPEAGGKWGDIDLRERCTSTIDHILAERKQLETR